ncbi:MAG: hypothetical protein E4G98_06265 [Promethearchaeota archaeon]|nr:MAG: hypothetical protein E4G98_06265 [Candidatus Lokiarchaeota archaeon]
MGISTIIVMNPSGIPYFSGNYICPNGNNCHVYSRDAVVQKDPSLVSGFFSALISMSTISGGELKTIAFEKFRYLAQSAPNVILIMMIDINDALEDYQNRVRLSLEIFMDNFGSRLEHWKGDQFVFNQYQLLLEEAEIFANEPVYRKNCIECAHDQDCIFRMVTGEQGVEITEKMSQYPQRNFLQKIPILIREYMKYLKQIKRFKVFRNAFTIQKETQPMLNIASFQPR